MVLSLDLPRTPFYKNYWFSIFYGIILIDVHLILQCEKTKNVHRSSRSHARIRRCNIFSQSIIFISCHLIEFYSTFVRFILKMLSSSVTPLQTQPNTIASWEPSVLCSRHSKILKPKWEPIIWLYDLIYTIHLTWEK